MPFVPLIRESLAGDVVDKRGLRATDGGRASAFVAVNEGSTSMNHVTKRADQILKLAKTAASEYGQRYVGTEHVLLAIAREGEGLGARLLAEKGATEDILKEEIDRQLKLRLQETWVMGRVPGAPNFRDVITRAANEARGMGNWQICSVHLLLALLAERDCVGHKTLRALGIRAEDLRKSVVRQVATA